MSGEVFSVKARITDWIDADTVEVHPLITPYGINVRVRLKDRYAVEDEDDPEEHGRVLALAKAEIGDVDDWVRMTNTRHHWDRGRLEARLDPA